jgi:hypothetical protein
MEAYRKPITLSPMLGGGLAIGFTVLMSGCSGLKVAKFSLADSKDGGVLAGVPFTMNKPQITVTKVGGANGAPNYFTMKVDYVPDFDARYTLQLDPATLASIDFSMAFDANGSLSDMTAKTTDQTATIVTSLGKLAAALDKSAVTEAKLVETLVARGDNISSSKTPGYFAAGADTPRAPTTAERTSWEKLKARLRSLAKTGEVASKFYYLDRTELEWLRSLIKAQPQADESIAAYALPMTAFRDNDGGAHPALFASIQQAYLAFDKAALEQIKAKLVKERAAKRAAMLINAAKYDEAFFATNERAIRWITGAVNSLPPELVLVHNLANMQLPEWQRRYVADLDQKILERRRLIRIPAPAQATARPAAGVGSDWDDSVLKALLLQRATVLGVAYEYQRAADIQREVDSGRRVLDEARFAELQSLNQRIIDAENAIKPAAPTAAKTEDPAVAHILPAPAGQAITPEWVKSQLNGKLPRYVVVVDRSEEIGKAAPPTPNPAVVVPPTPTDKPVQPVLPEIPQKKGG